MGKRGDADGIDGLVADFEEILPALIETTQAPGWWSWATPWAVLLSVAI